MGGSVIERMILLTSRSPRFRDLMRDLFAGAQEYSDLRDRLYGSLPRIAAEALASTLWNPFDRGMLANSGIRAGAGTPL